MENDFSSVRRIFIIFICIKGILIAQDANYWSHQYGSRSTLLGGAVIGSVLDLSGTYYNPGALSLIADPDVLLASKVFEYPHYILESDINDDSEIGSSAIGLAPSIVATMFDFDWQEDHRLGLSVFTRYDVFFDLRNTFIEAKASDPGNTLISDFQVHQDLYELWAGLSWSYKIQEKMGIGVTQYFTFRSHQSNIRKVTEIVSLDEELNYDLNSREYNYQIYSILWKMGITFDFYGLTIGLTATTPSVTYYGNGSSGLNLTSSANDTSGNDQTRVAAHFQKDVKAQFRTPWSIGVGTTFKIPKVNIYLSAEWFSPVSKYAVIEPTTFYSQIGSDTLQNGVTHELNGVLNMGLGFEYHVSEDMTVNFSFTTDFSAIDPDSDTNLSIASWDTYHLFTGSSFKIGKSMITLGFGYSYGKHSLRETDVLYPEIFDTFVVPENYNFKYRNYKFLIGFSI